MNSIIIAKRVVRRAAREYGVLAQLGEHLPYKQRVIGSSPIGPIDKRIVSDFYNIYRFLSYMAE